MAHTEMAAKVIRRSRSWSQRATETRDAARWFALAVGSLAVAGAFSLVLVAGRIPVVSVGAVLDPGLARRSLVVHVNLAMGVWLCSCLAGLFCLLPGGPRRRTAPVAVVVALVGAIVLIIPTFFSSALPVLSNYVPALDHRWFLWGLAVFAAGVALNFIDPRLLWRSPENADLPGDAGIGLRAGATAYLVALLTVGGAYAFLAKGAASGLAYYEQLFWGGGHVLQAANTLGMLACWLILLHRLTGRDTVRPPVAGVLFAAMLLPTLAGPWLTLGGYSGRWFTRMMQYGLFPVVTVFLAYGAASLWRDRTRIRHLIFCTPAAIGLATSVVMTLIGFGLGAMIVADTTLTPAHYHANIGAVTVAYMTVLLVLVPQSHITMRWSRLAVWQPLAYGAGQMLFVAGLAVAGTLGEAGRKMYGPAQDLHSTGEHIGLMIVGVGGILALGAGVLFIVIMWRAARAARRSRVSLEKPELP